MFQKVQLMATQLFSDPNKARVVLILSALAVAALVGGAPSDMN